MLLSLTFKASNDLRLAEMNWHENQNTSSIARKQVEKNKSFSDCYNSIAEKYRMIIRVDTLDVLEDNYHFAYLVNLMGQFKNTIVILAGRNVIALYSKYKNETNCHVIEMNLNPLTSDNSRTYLQQKQETLYYTFDANWMKKLFILAGGIPVLMDMALEWAQNHRPLPWMDTLEVSDLKTLQKNAVDGDSAAIEKLYKFHRYFEQAVIEPVADLSLNLNVLKLTLAKVYPLDLDGIMEMLNLCLFDAEELLERAQTSIAIKVLPDNRIKLHDEVQRLIDIYIWPSLDPDRSRELRDSRRAIEYLKRKGKSLRNELKLANEKKSSVDNSPYPREILEISKELNEKEIEYWTIQLELLRRVLELNVQEGYDLYNKNFELVRQEYNSTIYRSLLL